MRTNHFPNHFRCFPNHFANHFRCGVESADPGLQLVGDLKKMRREIEFLRQEVSDMYQEWKKEHAEEAAAFDPGLHACVEERA